MTATYAFDHLFAMVANEEPAEAPTLFDIAGIARREVSMASVLRFLLDPASPHGLGALFATELIRASTGDNDAIADPVEVRAEVGTREGNRIDLVIVESERITKIEFKIDAELTNPLLDYHDQWDGDWGLRKDVAQLNLIAAPESWCRRHEHLELEGGFKLFGLGVWAARVRRALGDVVHDADARYWRLVLDALRMLETYDRRNQMSIENVLQLADRQDEANDFLSFARAANSALDKIANDVKSVLEAGPYSNWRWSIYSMATTWIGASVKTTVRTREGDLVQPGLIVQPTGWVLELQPLRGTNKAVVERIGCNIEDDNLWWWGGQKQDLRQRKLGDDVLASPADIAAKVAMLAPLLADAEPV